MALLPITLAAGPTTAPVPSRTVGSLSSAPTCATSRLSLRRSSSGCSPTASSTSARCPCPPTMSSTTRPAGGHRAAVCRDPGVPVADVPAHQRLREHRPDIPGINGPAAPGGRDGRVSPSGSSPPTSGSAESWPTSTASPSSPCRYRTGGLNAPGRHEKVALSPPDSIDITPIPPGQTLSDLLAGGRDRRDLLAAGPRVVRHRERPAAVRRSAGPRRSATSPHRDLPDHARDRHPPRRL